MKVTIYVMYREGPRVWKKFTSDDNGIRPAMSWQIYTYSDAADFWKGIIGIKIVEESE